MSEKSKVKIMHYDTLSMVLSPGASIMDYQKNCVDKISPEDLLEIAKHTVNYLVPDGKPVFLAFIFLDNVYQSQRKDFETNARIKLEKAGAKFELVHESPYFCNRGYHYGNVLQFALFKVTKDVV